ncbi:site-specific recombinase [Geothrix sp. SG200]|uniref:site-specific recombinase n=1 Tax=Geothrix sp. SG200 TaxID=2922865 RepID=UPI001FAD93D1|nr:site-specific recombinase [Geothrix sp. SG200]
MPLSDPRLDQLLTGGAPNLEQLLRWLLEASPVSSVDGEPRRTTRLRRLHGGLVFRGLTGPLSDAWNHASAIRLLAETGLPDRTTLMGEGFLRIVDRIIPRLDPEGDLYALLDRLHLDEEDAAWVEGLPADLKILWAPLLAPPPDIWAHAARLLAHRAAAVGLSRDLLALDPEGSDADSPFFRLTRVVHDVGEHPHDPAARAAWEACWTACVATLAEAHARLDERGVSTDLVFRLELLEAQLTRIGQILDFAAGRGDGAAFAAELVRGSAAQHGLLSLLRTTVKRLARKVVEHTGETGEHYIARDRSEWWAMGRSAAGGGLLTAGTALFKVGLSALAMAPLLSGLTLTANYAVSFCAMQLLGFSLASKQPAMTASALARALEIDDGQTREIELVASITRTQVIATLGNVLITMPVAVGLVAAWVWLTSHSPLNQESALHSLRGTHPFHGWTLVFAALTGVLLWLSSLAAGWTANWSAYRCLPEALAQNHRIRSWLGPEKADALGRFIQKHLAGFAGYTALGALLVFVPMAFAFAGIHVEVRHVTLQAASLALGSATLWFHGSLAWSDVLWSLLGIGLIGVMNFAVSFALALWTALRARDLSGRASRRLWWDILRAFNRNPGRFLLPPRRDATLDSRLPGDSHA